MSRSGYSDDCEDQWALIRWRGAVNSAIRGKRGQVFLRELLAALDAMPVKRLVAMEFDDGTDVCALGSVARARGISMSNLDPETASYWEDRSVADTFGIANALAREIMYENDDTYASRTPEHRWQRVRAWVASQIKPDSAAEQGEAK